MASRHDVKRKPGERAPGPELRLLDRRAFVGFPPLVLGPGVEIVDFTLQIPDVTFPFNLTGGALRYQKRKLLFGQLELFVSAERVAQEIARAASRILELEALELSFRPGYLEGKARLSSAERTPLTFKVAFDGDGEKLGVFLYDVRLYGFSPTASVQVPVMLARAVQETALLPDAEIRGASGFSTSVLPELCRAAAVARGFKMPDLELARLSAVEVSGQGLRLRFSAGGLPPPANPDEELLLALEGARAFAEAESLIAEGNLLAARDLYLRSAEPHEAHPFAAERLLSLLVADPTAHELAIDVAGALASRREKSPVALWGEAVVREHRGEHARAAERYLALCQLARKNQESASAFFAAEAAARCARDHAPQMAVRALHEVLGLEPDHLPSLRALAKASDQSKDRAGAIRAYRRMAALARDPAEAAEAHVHLARLCAVTEDDVAGARLHCEAALRLKPDHPDALYLLGELCHRSGEHLRGIKALDRLREVALARHELERVGRANLLAGRIWETGLSQLDNAHLRYKEAVELLPEDPEAHFLRARSAEALGQLEEAIATYEQTVELAGPTPSEPSARDAAHGAHHALARLSREKLKDPTAARAHLEAALELLPSDQVAIEALLPVYRSQGKTLELAELLEKAAAITEDPARRAALWAESGELFRTRLSLPERADELLAKAVEADPRNRVALEGMLAISESRRDGPLLCRTLRALAEISAEPAERARMLRRLAVAARDLAFDLELLGWALTELLKIEPDDLSTLGDLCALERRRADMPALAAALERRAAVAEEKGEPKVASAVLRERAQVLESRLGRVGEALIALEKAARLTPETSVLIELADLSLRCERPEHARSALERVLANLPPHTAPEKIAEIHVRLGKACEEVDDLDAARRHYEQAFPLRRADDELGSRLEALYAHAGLTRELSRLWSARAQSLLGAGRKEAAAELWVKSARSQLVSGERESARQILHAALEHVPEGALAREALELLADLELAEGSRLEAAKLQARRAQLSNVPREAAELLLGASKLAEGTSREKELLAEAIEKDPTFAPARLRRAELAFEADPASALEDLRAALERPEGDPHALRGADRSARVREASEAARRSGQPEAAASYLLDYVRAEPEDREALAQLAQLYRASGAQEKLSDLLERLFVEAPPSERGALAKERAALAIGLGRGDRAVDALRELLTHAPKDAWAAEQLLGLLSDEGEQRRDAVQPERSPEGEVEGPAGPSARETPSDSALAERLQLLTVLVDSLEGEPRAQRLAARGRIHRRLGNLDAARADLFEAARSLSGEAAFALWREAAEIAAESNAHEAQLEAWISAASAHPEAAAHAASALEQLASAQLASGEPLRAAEGFAALAKLPLEPAQKCEALFGLAQAHLELRDTAAAESAFVAASRQGAPKRRVEALLSAAELAESDGRMDAAVGHLESALALFPRHAEASARLEKLFRATGNLEGLAELLVSSAARAPKSAAGAIWAELGALYEGPLERPEAAKAAFRRAASFLKDDPAPRERLARAALASGDFTEATRWAEKAAARLPDEAAASLLREVGLACREADRDEPAIRLLRAAEARVPSTGAPLEALALDLYRSGAIRESLPLLERACAETRFDDAPDRAELLWLALEDLREATGDMDGARAALERLAAERPASAAVHDRVLAHARLHPTQTLVSALAEHAGNLHPSERAAALWTALADAAFAERRIDDGVARLRKAAEITRAPLRIHERLATLFRTEGRLEDLIGELLVVADLRLADDDVSGALAAYEEEASLAETFGYIDEALKTLQAMGEICEDEGELSRAAEHEIRRAELLRDVRGDFPRSHAAFERGFLLAPSLPIAQLGASLAQRWGEPTAESEWLARQAELSEGEARLATLLERAKLLAGPLAAREEAEKLVRQVLEADPHSSRAETLLGEILEADGRLAELAVHYEEAAALEADPARRAVLFRRAAGLYQDRLGQPSSAAAALLAARAATPEDLELTERVAELLHDSGNAYDAAEFDAVLLEADPFRPGIWGRHLAFLQSTGDVEGIAALMLRRAERQEGAEAAESYLAAARAFREASAEERARLCEERAFELSPESDAAFEAVSAHVGDDVRKKAELLARRAQALPDAAGEMLYERAKGLEQAGESLLAAEAYDELLAVQPEHAEALLARAELAAAAGGPLAAQPYDRKLLAVAGETLERPVRERAHLRLGHAALASGALQDATDAFEAVVALEPEEARMREALSLLAEVHARTRNTRGLFDATLRWAKSSDGEEAESLYRRAADLFDDPVEAIDALVPLAAIRPSDSAVVDRAAEGLRKLDRPDALVALWERSAEATGGARAAELLLQAAQVAESALGDADRARKLVLAACEAAPDHMEALEAAAALYRNEENGEALLEALGKLVEAREARGEPDVANVLRLELARVAASLDRAEVARSTLEVVVHGGPSATGYASALDSLDALLERTGDENALFPVRAARAELAVGDARADLLDSAASVAERAGALKEAAELLRESARSRPSKGPWLRLAEIENRSEAPERAAWALGQAASFAQGAEKAELLLRASSLWQAAGRLDEARDLLERVAHELPEHLPAAAAAEKLSSLGDAKGAFELGFEPALAQGDLETALSLAEGAGQRDAVNRVLAIRAEAGDVQALGRLVAFHRTEGTEHELVALLERLHPGLEGEARNVVESELSTSYEALGNLEPLYDLLGRLEETPERIARRAQLAGRLGRTLEALMLRERLTESPEALEEILSEYLISDALPQAVRLAEALLADGRLSQEGKRLAAERLAPTREGAELAVRLWPELLAERTADPDGWTLYAEALRGMAQPARARAVDGFGASFAGTRQAPSPVPVRPVLPAIARGAQVPQGAVPISAESMPRLFGALSEALSALDAASMSVALDPRGGLEAYLGEGDVLVLGAGALAVFGPVELTYLLALALALGDSGAALRTLEPVEGWVDAAIRAFEAVPSALAASRVLGLLDDSVRGSDPARVDLPAVSRASEAFLAVARKALDLWR